MIWLDNEEKFKFFLAPNLQQYSSDPVAAPGRYIINSKLFL